MGIIDTHAHLFSADFDNDLVDIINRAKKVGVEKVLLPNIDETTIEILKNVSLKTLIFNTNDGTTSDKYQRKF